MLAKKIIITTFISLFACPLLMGMKEPEISEHPRYFSKELQGSLLVLMHMNSSIEHDFNGLPQEVVKAGTGIIQKNWDLYISDLRKSGHSGHRGFQCCFACFKKKLPDLNRSLKANYPSEKPVTIFDVMHLSDEGREVYFDLSSIVFEKDTITFSEDRYAKIIKLPGSLKEKFGKNATLSVAIPDDSADNRSNGSNSIITTAFIGSIIGGGLYLGSLGSKKLFNDDAEISLPRLCLSAGIGMTCGLTVKTLNLLKEREVPRGCRLENKPLFSEKDLQKIELQKIELQKIELQKIELQKIELQKIELQNIKQQIKARKPEFLEFKNQE